MPSLLRNLITDSEQYETIFKPNIKHSVRTFKENEKILEAGKYYDCFYFIKHGRARVVVDEASEQSVSITAGQIHTIIAELAKNEIFGEFSLFDGEAATADIIAVTETEVVEIDNKSFREFIQKNPDLGFKLVSEMLQKLINRVRRLNKTVSHLVVYSSKLLAK